MVAACPGRRCGPSLDGARVLARTSFEGRDLIGVRVSDDATDNLSEPGVFYVGQHHAREHLTVEVALS